jgi:3',5'-cyclic AMP phosphodiesterase CpdA
MEDKSGRDYTPGRVSTENKADRLITRREFGKTAALMGLGFVFDLILGPSSKLPAQEIEIEQPPDSKTKRLLLLADVHIGNVNRYLPRQINTRAAARLQAVVDQMKSKYFDWTIQLGDFISDIDNEKTNINNYRRGLKILTQLPSPIINIPGNHDIWGIETAHLSQTLQEMGFNIPLYGVREISPNCQMVWLDLAIPKSGQVTLPDERIDWLREVIKPDTPTIIFSHYGFLPPDTKGNYYYGNNPWATAFTNGPRAWNYLKDLPIRAVVSAHVHEGTFSAIGHTSILTVPSFTENIASTSFTNPGVYSILEVTDSHLNLKSYSGKYCFNSISI